LHGPGRQQGPKIGLKTDERLYSGTSLNGHLLIAATSLMQPLDTVLVEAPLIQYLRILPNVDTSLFLEADSFFFGPSMHLCGTTVHNV